MTDLGILHDTTELRKLIAENPDLPIVVCVGEEAYSGEWGYEYCANVFCELDEILDCKIPFGNGIVPTDKDDFEECLAEYLYCIPENKELSDEDFDKLVKAELAKYEPFWKKAIVIHADN